MLKFNRLAIIPARGGSKRINNKNLVYFEGKPIISYTIENAKTNTKNKSRRCWER